MAAMADPRSPATSGTHDAVRGTPVGRRVVLAMLGLGVLGVVGGARVADAIGSLAARDPTGLTAVLPGAAGFRYYSVAGPQPPIASADYRLRVAGLVTRPVTLTLDDLRALPQTGITADFQCVTGWRVNDVPWSGVLLRDLLAEVGVRPEARALEFGSSDDVYTESLTLDQARRDDVLVATSMLGGPVTDQHGGPVRLYVAPMYGYKSLKWLDRIELTEQVRPGYWEQRGYDVDAWVGSSNGRSDEPV